MENENNKMQHIAESVACIVDEDGGVCGLDSCPRCGARPADTERTVRSKLASALAPGDTIGIADWVVTDTRREGDKVFVTVTKPSGPDVIEYPADFEVVGKSVLRWNRFTRRTDEPKLNWLEAQLDQHNIEHRRNGESFHAPILEVAEDKLDLAWEILGPVDDIADDDEMFLHHNDGEGL